MEKGEREEEEEEEEEKVWFMSGPGPSRAEYECLDPCPTATLPDWPAVEGLRYDAPGQQLSDPGAP